NLLPLPNHAKKAVVHHYNLYVCFVLDGGGQFLGGHLKTPVAYKSDDPTIRKRELGSKRGGGAKAHRAQSSGCEQLSRSIERIVLSKPHLMLAYVGCDECIASGQLVQLLDQVLRHD